MKISYRFDTCDSETEPVALVIRATGKEGVPESPENAMVALAEQLKRANIRYDPAHSLTDNTKRWASVEWVGRGFYRVRLLQPAIGTGDYTDVLVNLNNFRPDQPEGPASVNLRVDGEYGEQIRDNQIERAEGELSPHTNPLGSKEPCYVQVLYRGPGRYMVALVLGHNVDVEIDLNRVGVEHLNEGETEEM